MKRYTVRYDARSGQFYVIDMVTGKVLLKTYNPAEAKALCKARNAPVVRFNPVLA